MSGKRFEVNLNVEAELKPTLSIINQTIAGESLKGSLTEFLVISHCSLRPPNRVCNIGWAENGPSAVLCPMLPKGGRRSLKSLKKY